MEARSEQGLKAGAQGNTLSVSNPLTGGGIGGVFLGMIFGYLPFGDPATTYGYFGGLGTLSVLEGQAIE